MINRKKQQSFTLIELLVVIVIIGILAGVIMISTSSSIDKANIAKVKVFEESIENNLAANMVSRWKLDEIINTNQTPDQWGSNIGTINGNPVLKEEKECISGKCMEFDGVGDYVVCANTPQLTQNVTISLWVKPIQTPLEYSVVFFALTNTGGGYTGPAWFEYRSSKALDAYFRDPALANHTPSSTLESGQWYYLVSSHDYTNQKSYLYVNTKQFIDIDPIIGQLISNGSQTLIGSGRGTTYGKDFYGLIDDVKLYDGTLSSAEIKQNYI
ncbi:MAG TPA: prepilin-type N-terminal cleavage/methylation domain-containing protein [Candidatus Pacearchaeota archaeon]|nr:prepilin-type N-terminal cleavage/methylation domain-containing protein [Candidatus Pacearchaeota archaeon]